MRYNWTGADGYPCTLYETQWAIDVAAAIRELDGGDDLDDKALKSHLDLINDALIIGDGLSRINQQPSSQDAAEKQLHDVHRFASKLVHALDDLKAPAHNELRRTGVHFTHTKALIESLRDDAREAFNEVEGGPTSRGRPVNYAAKEVRIAAERIFKAVTGKEATAVSRYLNSGTNGRYVHRTGPFSEFLQSCFDATLGPDKASAASHIESMWRERSGD